MNMIIMYPVILSKVCITEKKLLFTNNLNNINIIKNISDNTLLVNNEENVILNLDELIKRPGSVCHVQLQ